MKINLTNKPKLIEVKNIPVGEGFKYWPNYKSSPEHFNICMKTNGRFCLTECMEAWPTRFVNLMTGEECGTSEDTMVMPLNLKVEEA
jgi:hypothetical protein